MRNGEMGITGNWMKAAALGAGMMYFLDPDRGRRRRAMVRDKAKRLANLVERGTDKTKCDLVNRRSGIAAYVATHIPYQSEKPPDYILEARVRSKLGRLVSHPHAIQVRAHQGVVTLTGNVLVRDAAGLEYGIAAVPGVSRVENELRVHEEAGDFPGLQGDARTPQPRVELLQKNWSPAARFVTGAVGAAIGIYGMWKGGIRGSAAGFAGAGLLARSLTNMELKRLVSAQPGSPAIDVRKTIHIAAPVEKVYEFWTNYENFPQFMPHIKQVQETTPGRSHWVACGPGKSTVEWDAEITEVIPNQLLAWRSIPGSRIENTGIVRFDQNGHGTRVTVQLSYQPPAGAVGHALAKLFGFDPKQAMDQDLVRLKSLLEVGKTRVNGATVTQDNLHLLHKTLVAAGRPPAIH